MAEPEAVGICLHQLVAREEAVIKRVISFSSSQGRNYYATDLLTAQIVIVSDDQPVDFSQMNPEGSMIVRISGQGSTEPYDVLMMRPLLVTKVMRTLDEAHALLSESLGDVEVDPPVTEQVEPEPVAAEEDDSEENSESNHVEEQSEEQEAVTDVPPEPLSGQTDEVTESEISEQESVSVIEAEASEQEQESTETVESGQADQEPESAAQVSKAPKRDHAARMQAEEPDEEQYLALVVDDSAAIRKQLELELRDAGINADFAEDGEQALEKIAGNHYDLIFLDIIMPGIDGYEACRQMRLRPELKKTPIIMLSAKTSPLDEVQGVIAGASTYLTKPVKSEQLQSTLKRVSMWIDNFQAA